MFRALLELCRISNLPTVWTNVIAAWVLSNGGWRWDPRLGWLLLGASLVYSAGMILNDAADANWDRVHRPERPIPSGRVSSRMAWSLSMLGLASGYALMVICGGAGALITLALLIAIGAYDFYHKQWAGSVLVMGACRTSLYGAVASGGSDPGCKESALLMVVWISGFLLGIYIIALSLTARAEARGRVSPAARLWLLALLFTPLIGSLGFSASLGEMRNVLLISPAFVVTVGYALMKMRQGGAAIGQAVGWMLAAIPAVDALAVAPCSLPLALAFVALIPLLRLWQRCIAAT